MLLSLLGAVTIAASAAANEDQELGRIQALIDAGNIRLALDHADRYVDSKPGDPRALFLRARAQEKAGNLGQAVKTYERLIRDFPQLPEPFINLAAIHVNAGQYEKARQLLVTALNTHTTYAKIYESLNNLHAALASRAYQNALLLQGEAVKPKPNTVSALVSWPAAAQPGSLVAHTNQSSPAGSSESVSASINESRVEPVPPINEPVKVASRPESLNSNGRPIGRPTKEQPTPGTERVATRSKSARDDRHQLESTVKRWAEAWSRQEVGRYLSFYSDRFRPTASLSRKQWKQLRTLRITAKKHINVELSDFNTSVNGRTATVLFLQAYRSDTFSDVVRKKLVLERGPEGWKIIRETNAS